MQALIQHDAAMQVAAVSAKRQVPSNLSFGARAAIFSSAFIGLTFDLRPLKDQVAIILAR